MKSITYIKRNLTNLNRSILSQLLQSEGVELTDGLWNYLIETPWNTNWRLLEEFGIDIDEDSKGNADCNHPELGTLIYCGSASDKIIVALDGCDEGVQEGWCDVEKWHYIVYGDGTPPQACATGVFDGNIVSAEPTSENSIKFGDYLEVVEETDDHTGDVTFRVSELQDASHYAIYSNPITEEQI